MYDDIFSNKVYILFRNAVITVILLALGSLIASGIVETEVCEWI